MRAIELQVGGTARVTLVPDPVAGPGEVIVRVGASGVCGSDITALAGRHPFRIPPLISGHEGGGRVVEMGPGVAGVTLGEQVAIEPQVSCGICADCAAGFSHLCPRKVMLGVAEWPGTFAEYVRVPASTLHRIGDEIADELTALAEPLAVAVHAVAQAGEVAGADVIVLGGGSIGALVVHQLRSAGAATVIVTDLREGNRRLCENLGAETAFDPRRADWLDDARSRTRSGRFDIAIVCATADTVLDDAVGMVRPRGTVVQVALRDGRIPVRIAALQMAERRLVGSNVYSGEDFEVAIRELHRDPLTLGSVITARGSLEAGAEYLNAKVRGVPDDVVKFIIVPHAMTTQEILN